QNRIRHEQDRPLKRIPCFVGANRNRSSHDGRDSEKHLLASLLLPRSVYLTVMTDGDLPGKIIGLAAKLERQSRRVAVGVRQWARYLAFLRIILGRYDGENTPYFAEMNRLMELQRRGVAPSGPTAPDESDQLARLRSLEDRLVLDSESFSIFAKILLDRVADT